MPTAKSEPILTILPDLGEKLALKRTVRIRITANNPYLHNFISKSLRGGDEIRHGYRTYITMPTIGSEPILTIWPDLGETLA